MVEGGADNVWRGRRVRLRAVEPDDADAYAAWDDDHEMARNLDVIAFPRSRQAARRWAERESEAIREGDNFRFVVVDRQERVVGDVTVHDADRRSGTFSYGVAIAHQHRAQGYATEAVALVLRFFFEELRYQKVTVTIHASNEPSIRLHEKLGFQREGRIRRIVFTRGRHEDALLFGLTAEEFASGPAPRLLMTGP